MPDVVYEIKRIRAQLGVPLKEAKRIYDERCSRLNPNMLTPMELAAARQKFDEDIGYKFNPSLGKALADGFFEVYCKGFIFSKEYNNANQR